LFNKDAKKLITIFSRSISIYYYVEMNRVV
jgi:hypothetical protein